MKRIRITKLPTLLLLVAIITALYSCTSSPFENEIAPEHTIMTGQVLLQESAGTHEDVYIWLQGVKASTTTDSTGHFRLELPKELSPGLDGAFRLYFFVANYAIRSAQVIIRDGNFLYGHGDLNTNGKLKRTVDLRKILDIETIIAPAVVGNDYRGPISLQVVLRAISEPVTVIFPKSTGGLLGGILFRNLETQEIFIDIPDVGADTPDIVIVGREQVHKLGVFQLNGTNFRELFLPIGEYEVMPFFFVRHESLPSELLESIGINVDEPNSAYLNMPFRREVGSFRIIE